MSIKVGESIAALVKRAERRNAARERARCVLHNPPYVGLNACAGEVTENPPHGPMCEWHTAKVKVFGASLYPQLRFGRKVGHAPTRIGKPCPECGHTYLGWETPHA